MERKVKQIEKSKIQSAVSAGKVSTKRINEEIRVTVEQVLE